MQTPQAGTHTRDLPAVLTPPLGADIVKMVEHEKEKQRIFPVFTCFLCRPSFLLCSRLFGIASRLLFCIWLMKWWKIGLHQGLRAYPNYVSAIFCSGFNPECVSLSWKEKPTPFLSLSSVHAAAHGHGKCLSFCLFGYRKWTRLRDLFMYTVDFAHVLSRDVRSEGELPPELLQVSCPSLRSCGAPALSLTPNRLLAYCGSPLRYLQSPSLEFGFKKKKKSEVTEKQVAGRFWQSCQVLAGG